MDPSSFASAVASLLALDIQILSCLYGDWDAGSRPLVDRLTYELTQIRTVLQALEITSLSFVEPIFDSSNLRSCLEDLKEHFLWLGPQLSDPNAHKYEWQWRTMNMLERAGFSNISLSKSEGANELVYLRSSLSKLKDCIANSPFRSPEAAADRQVKALGSALWHDGMDYTKSHETAQETRAEGTGRWLLIDKVFKTWLNSDRSSNVLYSTGRPGSGKTVLTSLVVDEIRQLQKDYPSSNIGMAYFYFSYKLPSPIRSVTVALLEQLYIQLLTPSDEIPQLEARASKGEQIPFREILSSLSAVSKRFQKCYIVIDALDECASDYQSDLLHLLSSIRDSRSRLFVTSRPFQSYAMFESSPHIRVAPSAEDVEVYARSQLEKGLLKNDFNLLNQVVGAVVEGSAQHGMFLLVMLQVREVLDKRTTQAITAWLEYFQNQSASQGNLSNAYQKELDQISKLDPKLANLAKWTFTWLYFAQRPLDSQELLDLLRTTRSDVVSNLSDEQAIRLVVKSCMGLVRNSATVTFTHFSVKEFFDYNKEHSHLDRESMVAQSCLDYIFLHVCPDRLETPEDVVKALSEHPFLLYAANHWGRHALNLKPDGQHEVPGLRYQCVKIIETSKMVAILAQILLLPRLDAQAVKERFVKFSALHMIAYFGLTWALDATSRMPSYLYPLEDSWGRTAFHIAAEQGHVLCLNKLLSMSHLVSEVRRADNEDRTPWHYAAMSGNAQVVQELSAKYPLSLDHEKHDKRGFSPLQYAAVHGDGEAFKSLMNAYPGGKASQTYMDEALTTALQNGKTEIVQMLLNRITPRYEHLTVAINSDFALAVKLLLDYVDDLDRPAAGHRTALLEAALTGNNAILSFLIRSGASIAKTDSDGLTALARAVEMGNVEAVRTLLDAGANPATRSSDGTSLIVHAASRNMIDVLQLLMEAGPGDKDLKQAAFRAAEEGHEHVLRLLLVSDVLLNERSERGQTLSEVAREAGFENIVALLQDYGAEPVPRVVYSTDKVPPRDQEVLATRPAPTNSYRAPGGSSSRSLESPTPKKGKNEEFGEESHYTHSAEMEGVVEAPGKQARETQAVRPSSRLPPSTSKDIETREKTRRNASSHSSQRTSQHYAPTTIRSTPQSKAPAPVFLLITPTEPEYLTLGMIVADPRDPLRSFIPKEAQLLERQTSGAQYETVQYDWNVAQISSNRTNAAVASMLDIFDNNRASRVSRVNIRSPRLLRRQLRNHDHVVKAICQAHEAELLEMLNDSKEVFVVVGLLIATDLDVLDEYEVGNLEVEGLTTGISVPVGVEIGWSGQIRAETHKSNSRSTRSTRGLGNRVVAIQYRSLKLENRQFFRNLLTRAKETSLSLGTYFRGAAYETVL